MDESVPGDLNLGSLEAQLLSIFSPDPKKIRTLQYSSPEVEPPAKDLPGIQSSLDTVTQEQGLIKKQDVQISEMKAEHEKLRS